MIDLHPEILSKNGKREFVVLPYEEFVALQEELEELEDIRQLEEAIAAEKAGMQRGDILIRLGPHMVGSVEDLMYALDNGKPGDTVTAVVLRNGKELELQAIYQEAKRQH